MRDKVGVAFIGAGTVAEMHGRGISAVPNASLVGAYDIAPERRKRPTRLPLLAVHEVGTAVRNGSEHPERHAQSGTLLHGPVGRLVLHASECARDRIELIRH